MHPIKLSGKWLIRHRPVDGRRARVDGGTNPANVKVGLTEGNGATDPDLLRRGNRVRSIEPPSIPTRSGRR